MTTALSPRDREILAAWMHGPTGAGGLADELGMDILELLDWAARPDIAAILKSLSDFTLARAQRFLIACKSAALARLMQIIEDADDQRDARRAASAILRLNPRALGIAPPQEPSAPAADGNPAPAKAPTAPAVDSNPVRVTPAMSGVFAAKSPGPSNPTPPTPHDRDHLARATSHPTHHPRAP